MIEASGVDDRMAKPIRARQVIVAGVLTVKTPPE